MPPSVVMYAYQLSEVHQIINHQVKGVLQGEEGPKEPNLRMSPRTTTTTTRTTTTRSIA